VIFVLVVVLVAVLAIAAGLCSTAQRGDDLLAYEPSVEEYAAELDVLALEPLRCACGTVLKVEEWRFGCCGSCSLRTRLPRLRGAHARGVR